MLCSYEELPIGFGFLWGLEFIQYHQPFSDFDYRVVVIKKNPISPIFYPVFRYLAATQCISVFKYIAICLSFFYYLYLSYLSQIRYSTESLIKELHLYSFKLYQQVLYFNKPRFCGKKPHQVRYVVMFRGPKHI